MTIWAIVPVKSLRASKSRLSHILSVEERAKLTAHLLGRTLEVLTKVEAIRRTLVVSRDPAVLKIARRYDASTFGEMGKQDLNMALTRASHVAELQGADCALILPADLPFVEPSDLVIMIEALPAGWKERDGSGEYVFRAMAICGDQTGTGTNALLICPPTALAFRFGANSFNAHLNQAADLNMTRKSVRTPGLAFDLDTEEDWRAYLDAIQSPSQTA